MDRTEFVAAYQDRLGLALDGEPDLAKLRHLHFAHLRQVPFENLGIHLGEPLNLDINVLQDKVLRRRRGGFCYELNGIFAQLLEGLGYRVTLLGARVWAGSRFGPPLDHLALRVECPGETTLWLVDVGFGAHSPGLAHGPRYRARPTPSIRPGSPRSRGPRRICTPSVRRPVGVR